MTCPCHSGLDYMECCQSYHTGKELPESALCLMRSRYSAFAKRLASYLIETTHVDNPAYLANKETWEKQVLEFCTKTEFLGLKIEEVLEGEASSFITFHAHLSQAGKEFFLIEKSHFIKDQDQWLYYSGKILNQ